MTENSSLNTSNPILTRIAYCHKKTWLEIQARRYLVESKPLDDYVLDPQIYDDPIEKKTKSITIAAGQKESSPFSFQTRRDREGFAYVWGTSSVVGGHPLCLCRGLRIDRPTVKLDAFPNPVDEGESVTVTATISKHQSSRAVTVPLNYPNAKTTDTAELTEPTDYTQLRSITIPAGFLEGSVEIQTRLDADVDNETFTVAIDESSLARGVFVGHPKEVKVTINDHNRPEIVVLPTEVLVPEGGSNTVKVNLLGRPTGEVTVTISDDKDSDMSWSGTALSGDALTFTTTNWDIAQTVTLMAGEDNDLAHDTETLTLTAADGGYDNVTATIEVTIEDNDVPEVSFNRSKFRRSENKKGFDVEVVTDPPASFDLIYNTGGTATRVEDYDIENSGTLSVRADVPLNVIPVKIRNDGVVEGDETVILTLEGGPGYRVGSPSTFTLTIEDDDSAALVVDPESVTVAEGGSKSYTVKLAAQPSAAVTVAVTGHSGTDLTLDQTTLTFNPSGSNLWSTTQTVTVTASEDNDFANDTATLVHTASGGGYVSVTANVAVTVEDNDSVPLVVDPESVTVAEGGSKSYTVKLAAQPSATVTVAITGHSGTDLTPDKTTLTFNPSGSNLWSTAQTVTVTAGQDDDFENDTATLVHTASGGGYDSETADVAVTIEDDDSASLVVDPGAVTVAEGGSGRYMVKLAAQPSAAVTVAITGHSGTDLTLGQTTLTFNPSGSNLWSTAQTVTVSAGEDDDFANDTATLVHTASGGGYDSETADVAVTIEDDDSASLVVDPESVTVAEGGSGSYTVKLAAQPSAAVTVTVTGHSGTDLTLGQTTLTFNPSGSNLWSTAQTMTVTAGEDNDFANDTVTLVHTASGGGYDSETADVAVTIEDDDTPAAVRFISAAGSVDEGDGTRNVEVAISPAPTAPLTLIYTLGGTATENADYSITGSGTVSVAAGATSVNIPIVITDDTEDEPAETVILTLTDGTEYTVGSPNVHTLTITDNDETPQVSFASSSSRAPENKGTHHVAVRINPAPAAPFTLSYGTGGTATRNTDYTSSGTVSVATGWTSVNIPIVITDDTAVEDAETVILTLTIGTGYNLGTPQIHTLTIVDDDHSPSISAHVSLSASPNPVDEGASVTITATLTEALPDAVTINLRDTSGEPPTEPGDYGPIPRITIAGGSRTGSGTIDIRDDDVSEGDERFTVAIIDELPPGVVLGSPSSVQITIRDDDPPPPVEVTLSASPNPVDEGNPVTITARLTGILETNVVVPLAYPPGTAEPGDYTRPPSIMISSGATEGSGQIQTLTDADMENETFIVALGDLPPALLVAGRESSQFVTIRDITSPAVVDLSASPNPVDEGNGVTVTATLSEAYDTDVTIPLILTDGTANAQDYQALPPAQIEIEAGETSGTYRISAAPDDVAEENETFTVAFGVLPSGLTKGEPVEITITDDDEAGMNVPRSVSVVEEQDETFPIALTSKPLGNVVVTMTWPSGTDLTVSPITRIFTSENWNETQQVSLRAADDADVVNDQVEVTLTASGGGYTGISETVSVTITDNDAPGLGAPASVTMAEGSQRALAIALAQMPASPVTVTFGGHAGTDLALDQPSLMFTPSNWSTAQTVTLTAAEDDDFVDDTETLILTASGGGYAGVTTDITVTITDNDAAGLVAPETVQMEEGGTRPLLVRLSASPASPVTLTFTGHAGTDLILNHTSLTFTAADWNTSKTVTLTAAEDDEDYADETVDLKVTASGGGYDGVTADITVTIMDNDERPGPLTITLYDEQALEHVEAIQLPIELSRPVDQVVMVQYTSTAGTAEAGLDYVTSRGIVIFDPGATRGVIEIEVIDDELPEEHETFMVTLSKPRNAIIARETGTGTILDDDGASAMPSGGRCAGAGRRGHGPVPGPAVASAASDDFGSVPDARWDRQGRRRL